MGLVYILTIYFGLGVNLNTLTLCVMLFSMGCSKYKVFEFESPERITSIKETTKSETVKEFKRHYLSKRALKPNRMYTFQLPPDVCKDTGYTQIIPYLDAAYEKVLNRRHRCQYIHPLVPIPLSKRSMSKRYLSRINEKLVEVLSDTLINFRFMVPIARDASYTYEYDKKECTITYLEYVGF